MLKGQGDMDRGKEQQGQRGEVGNENCKGNGMENEKRGKGEGRIERKRLKVEGWVV